MKIKTVLVNWALYDEELLEPYEWKDDDDLECLKNIQIIRVDNRTMNDLLNNVITFTDKNINKVFIATSLDYTICIEIDSNLELKYRSVLTYSKRNEIKHIASNMLITHLDYQINDYCELKELGLTRNERVKKQYLISKLNILYQYQPQKLIEIYLHLYHEPLNDVDEIYYYFQKQINIGYRFLHEYLYKIFYLV